MLDMYVVISRISTRDKAIIYIIFKVVKREKNDG